MATANIRTEVTEQEDREIANTVQIAHRAVEQMRQAHNDGQGYELSGDQLQACVKLGFIRVF